MAIRRHGSRPPFFGVPFFGVPGNGGALCFHTLAQRLGSDQPFYGFQPQDQDGERTNLLEGENIATSSMSARCARCSPTALFPWSFVGWPRGVRGGPLTSLAGPGRRAAGPLRYRAESQSAGSKAAALAIAPRKRREDPLG